MKRLTGSLLLTGAGGAAAHDGHGALYRLHAHGLDLSGILLLAGAGACLLLAIWIARR
ncbi:MAG TPA: hypothetical protein VIT92_06460 [Burkholderiaceae bacterium]